MYYIYHIPTFIQSDGSIGKIGTSKNPKKRVAQQGHYEFEILEQHTCIDTVSVREMELQKQYGYRVDSVPYFKTRLSPTKEGCIKGGISSKEIGSITLKNLWKTNRESQLEICSKNGKIYGPINGKLTSKLKIGIHNPEKRKEYSQAGVKALYEKYTEAELKEIRGKGSIKKRKLTQEQIEFVKKHYHRTLNQHEVLPPNKMSGSTLAKMFNVNNSVIIRAFKS